MEKVKVAGGAEGDVVERMAVRRGERRWGSDWMDWTWTGVLVWESVCEGARVEEGRSGL